MLPTLEARESIAAANCHAVGSGMLDKESREQITGRWQKAASCAPRRAPKATPDQLSAMGIAVVPAPKES